jgi:hypothetical protein
MTLDASNVTCETRVTKIEPISNSRPHAHFTEHLVCVIENPPQEYDENLKSSSLWSNGSRTIPALTCKNSHTIRKLKIWPAWTRRLTAGKTDQACDRTPSEMRGPSSRIQIGWLSMKRECMQTYIRSIQTIISLKIKWLHFSLKIIRMRSRRFFKR